MDQQQWPNVAPAHPAQAVTVPVVLAGALKQMVALERWPMILERGAGVLMIGVGGYFLWLA